MRDTTLKDGRLPRRAFLGGLTAAGVLAAAGCSGGGDPAAGNGPAPAVRETVRVEVPPGMATAPFDVPRFLSVPGGFAVAVFARVPRVRFLAAAPNGDLLAAETFADRVRLLRPVPGGGPPEVHTFADGMHAAPDIVFHSVGGVAYVYIAQSTGVNRFLYTPGATAGTGRQVVVSGLPNASEPELQGAHGHILKNIALDSSHQLYVSSASATNASPSDVLADPPRAAILQYDAEGGGRRVFARGLRNAEGLAFLPGTDDLWVTVNQRENIRYPHDDGTGRFGEVVPEYVDNHPPEGFTRVRDGGNYGWPYANPTLDGPTGMDDMPFEPDAENNPRGAVADVSAFDRVTKGMQAHTAPLGLLFLQDTAFDARYRGGAVIALHGSWNRTRRVGYKFVYFPWDVARDRPGAEQDFVTGWLDEATQSVWGRPVDMTVAPNGDMYLSDDHSGTIYRLYRRAA